MKTVIIAPHPDDEWIGCGCTILKEIEANKKVTVLLITMAPHSKQRMVVSQSLAKEYKYELRRLNEPERNINEARLAQFLKKNISKGDSVYVPSPDSHPDHKKIFETANKNIKNAEMYEYAVYNNSSDLLRKIKNRLFYYIKGYVRPSFSFGKHEIIVSHKSEIKNDNIKLFGEVPRGPDVLRRIYHRS